MRRCFRLLLPPAWFSGNLLCYILSATDLRFLPGEIKLMFLSVSADIPPPTPYPLWENEKYLFHILQKNPCPLPGSFFSHKYTLTAVLLKMPFLFIFMLRVFTVVRIWIAQLSDLELIYNYTWWEWWQKQANKKYKYIFEKRDIQK